MAKDKKKKFFQGREHLQAEVTQSTPASGAAEQRSAAEHQFIRKDLIGLLVLMSLFFLLLAGLTVLDKTTNILDTLAQKITSILIK